MLASRFFCPVTDQIKEYPFEVSIPTDLPVKGAVPADQGKSLDWKVRKAELIFELPGAVINEVLAKVLALL
jgi:mRNA interferase MazF